MGAACRTRLHEASSSLLAAPLANCFAAAQKCHCSMCCIGFLQCSAAELTWFIILVSLSYPGGRGSKLSLFRAL
jgi:hypothetical protein